MSYYSVLLYTSNRLYHSSLHDALPISAGIGERAHHGGRRHREALGRHDDWRAVRCAGQRRRVRTLVQTVQQLGDADGGADRKSTRLNSSHEWISYAVFCLKKKN